MLIFSMIFSHLNFFNRFTIAIKTSQIDSLYENQSLLNEAKVMLKTERYHDHIVNLQGLTLSKNENEESSLKVST